MAKARARLEVGDDLLGEEAHQPARESKAARVRALSGVEPNPLAQSRTRVARLERAVEIARDIRRPVPLMRHVYGEMGTNGQDRSTIPRSERLPERPRDRGWLDLDPMAHMRAR